MSNILNTLTATEVKMLQEERVRSLAESIIESKFKEFNKSINISVDLAEDIKFKLSDRTPLDRAISTEVQRLKEMSNG